MKYWILAFIVIVLAACSNQESEQSIRDQITSHRKDISTLNLKIAELEKKLNALNSGDDKTEKVPVEVMKISLEPFNHYIQVSGTAEAVKEAFISPEVGGQLREIYIKEGDYVEKGHLLAKLNTDITESSIADLESSLALATTVYEKQARLWEKGIGSEIQYLNAKNNKESLAQKLVTLNAQLDMALVKSPVSGIVDEIYRKKGEMAMPGAQLMQIVNLEELYINADVSESYLSQVNEGATVKVEFPVYPDMSFDVPIYRKGNIINPNNRTFAIQLKMKNPDHLLKPNILSIIHIRDFSADSAVVIPSAVIKQDITGSYLYTIQQVDGKWIAKKVYVTPGRFYIDKTMVVSGIQPGQQVIIQGYNEVSDGSEVYIKTDNAS
jgi:membrane fusion protein (multidrug efflux system)